MKLGILSFPSLGHLNPMFGIARELRGRGHDIVFFSFADIEQTVLQAGFAFVPVGISEYPLGTLRTELAQLSKLKGLSSFRLVMAQINKHAQVLMRDLPFALTSCAIEGLIIDQVEAYGGTVADHLSLPYVAISNAVPFNRDPDVPPFFLPWSFKTGVFARLRNELGYTFLRVICKSLVDVIKKQRKSWHLPLLQSAGRVYSPLADITQLPQCLDFPRASTPVTFHHAGPFSLDRVEDLELFPWDRLDDRRLVYASMGTIQNGDPVIFKLIAAACAELDVQLVLSIGSSLKRSDLGELPGDPIVVNYAPQLHLLKRAHVLINHGGINTVLDALSFGVPMVLIPVTSDQPGMAARIDWSGSGIVLNHKKLTLRILKSALSTILETPSFKTVAMKIQREMSSLNGPAFAVNIIEDAMRSTIDRQPRRPHAPVPGFGETQIRTQETPSAAAARQSEAEEGRLPARIAMLSLSLHLHLPGTRS
jgi:zeaxanthin glucosyltransferase